MSQTSGTKSIDLESIFNEIAEVLEAVIENIITFDETTGKLEGMNTFSEFLDNLLEIGLLILNNPKYRDKITNSKTLIRKIVDLLDKVENRKAKLIIVKVIIYS